MSKSVFESKKWKRFMAMAYGLGASIVIVGALFKILHWKGADFMLMLGMFTEAFIFFISAFEPVHEEVDWSLVYPELAGMEGEDRGGKGGASVSQQLDQMLSEAKVGPELIQGLGTGLKSLSENVGNMADLSGATVATREYADAITKASSNISGMNSSYSRAMEALGTLADTTSSLAASTESFKESSNVIANVNQSLSSFNKNIDNLNKVYGGMLTAMRPSN
jgi:gliding motility-associated protein GldL